MKLTALLVLLAAGAATAQTGPGPIIPTVGVPPQLHLYLELTQEQVGPIVRLNTALTRFQSEKYRRASEVQGELREEMARPSLDAMAIGLRYVELEAINREIQAEREKTVAEIQKLFTAAQKTKLKALEDVLKAYDVACSAIAFNLMPPPQQELQSGTIGGIATSINGFPNYPSACGGSYSRVLLPLSN